jgi:uncharacterized protein YndB with AHSA1/START domain
MSLKKFIAKVEIDIVAPIEKVWEALTNPAMIHEYMFGTNVSSNWKPEAVLPGPGSGRANLTRMKVKYCH